MFSEGCDKGLFLDRGMHFLEGIKEGVGMRGGKIGEELAAAEEDRDGSYIPLQFILEVRIAVAERTEVFQSPLGIRSRCGSILKDSVRH